MHVIINLITIIKWSCNYRVDEEKDEEKKNVTAWSPEPEFSYDKSSVFFFIVLRAVNKMLFTERAIPADVEHLCKSKNRHRSLISVFFFLILLYFFNLKEKTNYRKEQRIELRSIKFYGKLSPTVYETAKQKKTFKFHESAFVHKIFIHYALSVQV